MMNPQDGSLAKLLEHPRLSNIKREITILFMRQECQRFAHKSRRFIQATILRFARTQSSEALPLSLLGIIYPRDKARGAQLTD
jgi:hypothetical protein